MDEDVKDMSHMSECDYKAAMKKIENDSALPCIYCTVRCWDTGLMDECKAYRAWWRRTHDLRRH